MIFFTRTPYLNKKKDLFFFVCGGWGGGWGARVIDFFYKESKFYFL